MTEARMTSAALEMLLSIHEDPLPVTPDGDALVTLDELNAIGFVEKDEAGTWRCTEAGENFASGLAEFRKARAEQATQKPMRWADLGMTPESVQWLLAGCMVGTRLASRVQVQFKKPAPSFALPEEFGQQICQAVETVMRQVVSTQYLRAKANFGKQKTAAVGDLYLRALAALEGMHPKEEKPEIATTATAEDVKQAVAEARAKQVLEAATKAGLTD